MPTMLHNISNATKPAITCTPSARSQSLLVISASTQAALVEATAGLAAYLKQHPELTIVDVTYTLQTGRTELNHRRFVVCQDRVDALNLLESTTAKRVTTVSEVDSFHRDRKVAFLFPGLGEQYVELARALYRDELDFRETIEYCCTFLKSHLNLDLHEIFSSADDSISPPSQPAFDFRAFVRRDGHDAASKFAQPTIAHPATFVLEYALTQLLQQWGIRPAAMIGYSLGEYVAACLSGVLSLEDALILVAKRAQLIQDGPQGAMLAVNLAEKDVHPYLTDKVNLAAVSSPVTCVLAGPNEAIDDLNQHFTRQEIVCYRVTTTYAFHSAMLDPLREEVTRLVRNMKLSAPRIPYLSNLTGTWITAEQATDSSYWARHMCQTVRFADSVQQLLQDPALFVLEVGPGRALSSFVKQHPACGMKRMPLVQATLPAAHERQSCQSFLLNTLGKLWQAGVKIDWAGFHVHEQRHYASFPPVLNNTSSMEVKP